jgi:hypothetical protein
MVRCIQAACGHVLPRRVNFCPYCGTAQGEAGTTQAHPAGRSGGVLDKPVRGEAPVAAAAGARRADAPGPTPELAAATRSETAAPAASAPPARAAAQPAAQAAAPSPAPAAPAGPRMPPPPVATPAPHPARGAPVGAAPPRREPVRLRWWLLALAALWAIWLIAKPSSRRVEAQMDKAIALASECKAREAQSELIALRGTKATPEQLQRVQKALNEASASCTRKRQRDKAWREAKPTIESALSASSFERARARLRAFTRRWGEDDDTRALKEAIDARAPEHRRADDIE